MGDKTAIQWCDASFNPWWGCVKISPGCTHCYASDIAHHYKHDVWGPASTTPRRFFGENHWKEPITWNKLAQKAGQRRNVFCASMADVFEQHPDLIEQRIRLWNLIEKTPWLNWLLLTKRPENVFSMVRPHWICNNGQNWPQHVWIGTSVESQKYADERLPILLEIPAPVCFASYEPALGAVDFSAYIQGIDWLICGGESGPHHRPFDLAWARSARDQVLAARSQGHQCQYFFKQVGGRTHNSGGRLLDGRTWDEIPPQSQGGNNDSF